MLTIRLTRTGKRHKPQYRIVLQEKGRDPWSPAIENLGTYNPHTSPSTIELKEERITHWLSMGAQPSNTVHNMLVNAGIIKEGKKVKAVSISKKRKTKLATKDAEKAEKTAEAKTKAKETAEAEKAVAKEASAKPEAPKEEVKKEATAEEPKKAKEAPAE